jgi:cytoskeletal protein RodZ
MMAHQTETRWEKSDGKLHKEEQIPPVKARQGRMGYRILTVLIVALVLAFVVWIPVEIWGNREADEVAPQQPGQQLQSQQPAPAPTPQNGTAVPTGTPNTTPAAPNVAPATPAQ